VAYPLKDFAFDAAIPAIEKAVSARMLDSYTADGHPSTNPMIQRILEKNAAVIAGITHEELQAAKGEVTGDDTPETIAHRIGGKVEARLHETYAQSDASSPLKLAVDGMNLGVIKIPGIGEKYFTLVREGIEQEIRSNLDNHAEQFAALKPSTQVAQMQVPAPPETASPAPGIDQESPPPLPPSDPVENASAPPPSEPSPLDKALDAVTAALVPSAAAAEPSAGDTVLPPAEQQKQPPAEPAPPADAAPAVEEEPSSPASPATPAAPQTPSFPDSLSGVVAGGAGSLAALADPEQVKGMIRGGIRKMGQDPANFSEKDINGLAEVLQETAGEWMVNNKSALGAGNLSPAQLRTMSRDIAMGVRTKMTPERVGKFAQSADPFGFIDTVELITGVDKKGTVTHPYEMNIFGITEAALTSAAGSDEAKKRYQEQLALEESRQRFYASEEGKHGVTPELASSTARSITQKKGYGQATQDAVSAMADKSFQPSWWDTLLTIIQSFINGIASMFMGQEVKVFDVDWETKSAEKNGGLFKRIVSEQNPDRLGYTGSLAEFDAWKRQLATDVTGIHISKQGTLIDHTQGKTEGLAAVIEGLDADGKSHVPGLEGVQGINHDVADKAPRQNPGASESRAPAAGNGNKELDIGSPVSTPPVPAPAAAGRPR